MQPSSGSVRTAVCLIVLAALCSCQSQNSSSSDHARPLSVEDARKLTAQFQNSAFEPPPRTIDDVAAILDQQQPDPNVAKAKLKIADANPPSGLGDQALSDFYEARAQAAEDLGRYQQQVSDLQIALKFGRAAGKEISRISEGLSEAELQLGNGVLALDALNQWQASIPGRNAGAVLSALTARARLYAMLGEPDKADEAYKLAQQRYESAKSLPAWPYFEENWTSQIISTRGSIAVARGQFAQAESAFREAEPHRQRSYEQMNSMRDAALRFGSTPMHDQTVENGQTGLMLQIAEVLRLEGKVLEAEVYARRALLLLLQRRTRYSPATMHAVLTLADILNQEGRYTEAERLGKVAVQTYAAIGAGNGSWALAGAYNLVAEAQAALRHWEDAATTFQNIEEVLAGDDAGHDHFLMANPTLALIDLNSGHANVALPILRRAVEARERTLGKDDAGTAEARGLLAVALAASSTTSSAKTEFETAIPILLRNVREATDPAIQTAAHDEIIRQIFEGYMTLVERVYAQTGAEPGFALIDVAHGQSTQHAIAASSARAAVTDPALADLIRRYQDAQQHLQALEGSLANILAEPTSEQNSTAVQRLQVESSELQKAVLAIRAEIARQFPDYARLISPSPPSFAAVRQSLQTGEVLIATHVAPDRTFVWAVPKEGPVAFASVAISQAELASMVAGLRRALNPTVSTLNDIPPFDTSLAYRLFALLITPVQSAVTGARTLIAATDNVLTEIPFGVLVTQRIAQPSDGPGQPLFAGYQRVPFLVRQLAIAQLPSVTALVTLRHLPSGDPSRRPFVGFGDPWFNAREEAEAKQESAQTAYLQERGGISLRAAPSTDGLQTVDLSMLPRLPDTAGEVREVAAALKADPIQDIFLGAAASEHRVRTMRLDDRRVVMFATHGLVPGDLDGLTVPALALTAPSISGDGGDGLLTLEKILGLKLDADWVVLSACNTAAAGGAGAEAVSGLGRAFFYAGARALLVTNWPVETTSARLLTTGTFRHETNATGVTRAEALRLAEIDLIDGAGYKTAGGAIAFSYAHPIFWAPFSLVGDGG
jgi:CHAT domain-containing protein